MRRSIRDPNAPCSRAPRRGATRARCGVAVLVAALLIGGAARAQEVAASKGPASPLAARLSGLLAAPALRGAQVGALVVRERDGAVLFARDADRPLAPASNQKLLTALAALDAWGPAHRFQTEVLADRMPDADGAVGLLAVRGGGDPALTSEELWRLAADLRRLGLRRVRGPLVLDDSLFDRERWNPAWGEITPRAYHAPIGALSANYGAFRLDVSPGAHPGAPVRVALDPPLPYLGVTVEATTREPASTEALRVERVPDAAREPLLVAGSLPAGTAPMSLARRVDDPARYAGALLRLQLEANGITVEGDTQLGPAPAGVRLLAFEGRPLAEIVRLMLKYSSNPIAEMLLKGMGAAAGAAPAGWEDGLAALRRRLGGLGLDPSGLVLRDGSGLSAEDRIPPRFLVAVLRAGRASFAYGPEFVSGLPIAGEDGTLEKRARDVAGRVRAKTGLLDGVVALSGFAETPGGDRRVFSLLVNGYRCPDEAAMRIADGFAAEIVQGGAQATRLQDEASGPAGADTPQ